MLARMVDSTVFIVLGIIFIAWGADIDWKLDQVGALEVFPLLGLIAFGTMWWHFFSAFLRRLMPDLKKMKGLHTASAYWVFASFMLHPALLLFWGLENEVGEWPVEIYESYVGENQMIYIYLGLLGLAGFVLFDIARVLSNYSFVNKYKNLVTAVSDISFGLILIHSLSLGRHLQAGWFRYFWLLLGLSGIFFIGYRYYYQKTQHHETRP